MSSSSSFSKLYVRHEAGIGAPMIVLRIGRDEEALIDEQEIGGGGGFKGRSPRTALPPPQLKSGSGENGATECTVKGGEKESEEKKKTKLTGHT